MDGINENLPLVPNLKMTMLTIITRVRIAPIIPLYDPEIFFTLTIERENSAVELEILGYFTDMKIRADPNLKILANMTNLHENNGGFWNEPFIAGSDYEYVLLICVVSFPHGPFRCVVSSSFLMSRLRSNEYIFMSSFHFSFCLCIFIKISKHVKTCCRIMSCLT